MKTTFKENNIFFQGPVGFPGPRGPPGNPGPKGDSVSINQVFIFLLLI